MKKKEIIVTKPIFKRVLWGGERIRKYFGYEITNNQVGECWAISGHKTGDCEILMGTDQGKTLGWLWKNKRELFGNFPGKEFPLLVKIIDAKDDLSIQVHPDDNYALKYENGALGKTECWYVLDALENTDIVIGHHAQSKKELEDMVRSERWDELLRVVPLQKGDFFQINPGTIHAIKGGSLILEIQQSSNLTYRLYDYNRLQNGKKRKLHLEKSMDVVRCPYEDPVLDRQIEEGEGYLKKRMISCSKYTVEMITVDGKVILEQNHPFLLCSVIEGQGYIDDHVIQKGSHFIIPFGYGQYELKGKIVMMTAWAETDGITS